MFTLIRGGIIVGLIFYFSPARDNGEPEHAVRGEPAAVPRRAFEGNPAKGGLWERIAGILAEEAVRTACIYRCDGTE